jgi:hypothetical protein
MKKLFLLFLILIPPLFVGAQTAPPKNRLIKTLNDIGLVIVDNYKPHEDSVKNNCWSGCVFIRFTINSKRQFTNIDYTAITPMFVKNALISAFSLINQKANQINQLPKIDDSTYILPIIIYNKEGCVFMTGWEDASYKPDKKTKEMYAMMQESYIQSTNSIFYMLNFFNSKADFIRCVLLAPVRTGSYVN